MDIKAEKSLSFNFDNFSANQLDVVLQGDATIRNNVIQLTRVDSNGLPEKNSVGQALFSAPVRLWDSSSARLSKFETAFTFVISKPDKSEQGDGLTFFMTSADDTTIPPNSDGKNLGLFGPDGFRDNVVAVQFVTFPNPDFGHIGIDVHSIKSVKAAPWACPGGEVATAYITYDPTSSRLAVSTNPSGNPTTVSYEVELKTVLPEWVKVGFSASTGAATQISAIHSWAFTSTLKHN